MSTVSALHLRVEKDVYVRIRRVLKGKGVINVSENQEVSPEDLIGTANVSPGFRVINLSKLLSAAPDQVGKYIRVLLGQKIYKGELLAEKSIFLGAKKIVTSPSDGVLDFINPKTGEIRLTFLPKKEDLPSGVYGIVESIDKEKGEVIIRTQVSLVHGMFGSGRIRDGILRRVSKRDELVGKSAISSKANTQILFGGSLIFKDAITSAISCGVSGIITGGINAKDYRGMAGGRFTFPKKAENDIGISIVACEGFGSIAIGEDIYEILTKYEDRYILINGNKGIVTLPSFESKSMLRVRKVNLGPLNKDSLISYEDKNEVIEIKTGLKVRIVGNSFLGEQGIVYSVDQTETLLPSGIKTLMAVVETKRRKIQVPVANLEIIL